MTWKLTLLFCLAFLCFLLDKTSLAQTIFRQTQEISHKTTSALQPTSPIFTTTPVDLGDDTMEPEPVEYEDFNVEAINVEPDKSVVIQIFGNDTSFEDIEDMHQNWASESGNEVEFVIGEDLEIEFNVTTDSQGNLEVTIVFVDNEEEQVVVIDAESVVDTSGGESIIIVSQTEEEENIVTVQTCGKIKGGKGGNCETGGVTTNALGGGGQNCQDVVTCQWVNIPKVGLKKVCKTETVCS